MALGLAAGALFLHARSFDADGQPDLRSGGRLPIVLPDGRHGRLADLVRPGRPTVVALWATWCGPCRMEAPKLAELRRRLGPERLNFVYLNVRDGTASHEQRAEFLSRYGIPAGSYVVAAQDRLDALTGRSENLIPRTMVFDRAGTPLASITGYKPLALNRVAGLIGD